MDCHVFPCAKNAFSQHVLWSHSADVSQLGFSFFNLLTPSPTDNGHQVLNDCNIDLWSRLRWYYFKSAWFAVFWTSGISRHADAWRPIRCTKGLICQPCFDCLVVTSTLNDSSISLLLCEKSISADTVYDEINVLTYMYLDLKSTLSLCVAWNWHFAAF